MDCAKIGRLIADLRKEKGYTQQGIADALNISNKTVSKWECGLGCPDVSLWPELSVILNVDIRQMIEGEIVPNAPDAGNIEKIRFYVCPNCKNVLTSTASASLFCCGRKLESLVPEGKPSMPKGKMFCCGREFESLVPAADDAASEIAHGLSAAERNLTPAVGATGKSLTLAAENTVPEICVMLSDLEYFISIDHPMVRSHYLLFAAYVKNDTVILIRMYPEQDANLHLPYLPGGNLYLYCTEHGLSVTPIPQR